MTFHAASGWRAHLGPVALLALLILLANGLALSGLFDCDPALFITGLGIITQRGIWFGSQNWYDPNIGSTVQALGHLAAQDWLRGIVPWWDPYSGVGVPLAAEMQNYALFLPFVLLLHFGNSWLLLRILFQLLAGLFTYALVIQIGFSRLAALLAGVLYGCMSSFIMLPHAPAATFVFTPLLLIGIERSREAAVADTPMGWSLVTVAIAYSFYAGFPETAFLGDVLGGAWFVVRAAALPWPVRGRYAGKFAIAVVLGLALILPGAVPFLQYTQLGALGPHAGVFAHAHLPAVGFSAEFLPIIFGPLGALPFATPPWNHNSLIQTLHGTWGSTGGWIGAPPLLLGIAGALSGDARLRDIRWLLAAWILFWEARIFGLFGISGLLDLTHIFNFIAVHRYAEPSCDFAVILLGASAVDHWQRNGRWPAHRLILVGLGTIITIGAALAFALPTLRVLVQFLTFFGFLAADYVIVILLLLATILLILRQPPTRGRATWLAAVIVFDTVVGFGLSQAAGARAGRLDLAGVGYLSTHLGYQRVFTMGPLEPNYGAAYGIAEIDYDMLPIPKSWSDYVAANLDSFADPIVFNGTYDARPDSVPTPAAALRMNFHAYPSIGVKYVLAPPNKDPFAGMPAAAVPPAVFSDQVMKIYQLPNPAPYFSTTGSACTLAIRDRQTLAADCPAAATLIRRELSYPGWHAAVNGAAAPIAATEAIFESIPLPPGHSEIHFFYRPTHIRIACAWALTALLAWVALALRSRRLPPTPS